jgi:hypothetical protein
MNKKIIVYLLLVTMVSFSCKKDNNSVAKINVSVITETNNEGSPISQIGNTDWTADNVWTAEELALFQTPTSAQLTNSEKATVSVLPGFPNPCTDMLIFASAISKPTLIQLVITDNMLLVKERIFTTNSNNSLNLFALNLDASKYANITNYRMYYGFYSSLDGLYYKGHGDFKIRR